MRRFAAVACTFSLAGFVVALGPPAAADHTQPRTQLAPTEGTQNEPGITRGAGTWKHIRNFRGGADNTLTGGGTDLEFFTPHGTSDIFGSFGTLGQDQAGNIGQRFLRLTRNGQVDPRWVADHGSAHCQANTAVTGLQHDVQVARIGKVTLITDTTDARGRCHDTGGGGIEIMQAEHIANAMNGPFEVHLVRFAGFSHTNTIDQRRPWIVYNNNSEFGASGAVVRNWIDVMDMKSCVGTIDWTYKKRRAECRPKVYRIQFKPEWTQQRDQNTGKLEPGSAGCHDITYAKGRLYCAALNATLIIDVSGLVDSTGRVKGTPLPCTVIDGTRTGAKVTDCEKTDDSPQRATGWRFLGTFQHPGRDCVVGIDDRRCNSNNFVPSDEGVSVSHEADPTPDGNFMFVTDERGGGIVPPGASCAPGIENPIGNGGVHAFNITDPGRIRYATTPWGAKAVYISDPVVADPTFCDVHVIEHVAGEQRLIVAYYSQGIKIVDYFVDGRGNIQFYERASFTLPNTNVWAAEDFKIRRNADGTRTYFIAANDIHRGIDIVSWTGKPNLTGAAAPPAAGVDSTTVNAGLVGVSALAFTAAIGYRRWRRRPALVTAA